MPTDVQVFCLDIKLEGHFPSPMGRAEFLSEQGELRNSGGGFISFYSNLISTHLFIKEGIRSILAPL